MSVKMVGKGRYQIRVNRIDPKTGRKVNRKLTVEATRDQALALYGELRAEVTSTAVKPRRQRLNEYAPSWLEVRPLRDTTRRRYGVSLTNILPALGDYYLDSITPAMIQAYINARTNAGAAGYTVLNELRLLRTLAKDAHAEGLCERVFTDRVRAPKVSRYTKDNPNRLTAEQFRDVFAHLQPKWKPITLLMVTTGLRWGEASAIHGADVRLWKEDEETIGEATIKWNNDRGTLVEKHSDTKGTDRTVPLAADVVFLLRPLLAQAKKGSVFKSRTGKLYASPAPLLRALRAAEDAAGIPYRVTVHGLRRTWKNLAKATASREVLKAIGGWSTDAMLEHYDHVASEEKQAAARGVMGTIKGVKKK